MYNKKEINGIKAGVSVKFKGAEKHHFSGMYSSGVDPSPHLTVGDSYVVEDVDVENWTSTLTIGGRDYNTVCFELVD